MTTAPTFDMAAIVHRLTVVENEVAELKRHVPQPPSQPWYLKHAGKFAGDSEFQEIVRLGKEIRDSDRLR